MKNIKKKPFFNYKKLPSLSTKNQYLLGICLEIVIAFFVFSFSYWSPLAAIAWSVSALVIIFIYLLSNSSPAKSISRLILFIGSTLLLVKVIYMIIRVGLPEYQSLLANNQGPDTSGFTRGLLLQYFIMISLPLYGLLVLFLTNKKRGDLFHKSF